MMRDTQEKAPLALLERAKAIGADALIIKDEKRPGNYMGIHVLVLSGIAIRYVERPTK